MALSKEWIRKIEYYLEVLPDYVCQNLGELQYEGFITKERLPMAEAKQRVRQKFEVGMPWGQKWEYAWMFATVEIPAEGAGKRVVITSDNGECVVWVEGKVYGAFDKEHFAITLSQDAVPGTKYDVAMEVYAGHGVPLQFFGAVNERTMPDPADNPQKVLKNGRIAIWNDEIYAAWLDLKALYDLRNHLDEHSARKAQIDKALKAACAMIDLEQPYDKICASVAAADALLKEPLACKNGSTMPTAYAFGHAHLDLEWLWTDQETRRKCARTLGNQLRLFKEYPEYVYLQSQPWIMNVVKTEYPELYGDVKEAVKSGNIVVEGGMWVESDLNTPSGESLVRQLLHGKRFIKEEFGKDSKMVWLPDVFGCGASLPQIMKGCGIDYFVNNKLPWVYNGGESFPLSNFIWKGIDGTEIPVYMCEGYCCENRPGAIISRWMMCRNKEDAPMVMYPFGFGDGGGGATREHLELAKRTQNLEGVPYLKLTSPLDFFEDLKEYELKHTYCGELYYPAHRGTYTSQAKTKMLNRKAELALRNAEMCSALFGDNNSGIFDELWKTVLFNQFHDIIPGSSIHEVYVQAEKQLQEVIGAADQLTDNALRCVMDEEENGLTLFNSLAWERRFLVELPEGVCSACDESKNSLLSQRIDGRNFVSVTLPSCGMRTICFGSETAEDCTVDRELYLENDLIRVLFDEKGEITSIVDKESGLEYLQGRGNQFKMYADMPLFCDAWDIDSFYEEHEIALMSAAEISEVSRGELFSCLQMKKKLNDSELVQTIVLEKGKKQVDFHTEIDWNETHKLLKVFFDTNFNTTDIVSEMQYCHISRPAHKSTDYAADRFEVPQHKWSALMEGRRSFAILNDCKYGIGADGGKIGLTLLKSAAAPDFTADKGHHEFVYSVSLENDIVQIVRSAYELNVPVPTVRGIAEECSLFEATADNVILDAVKPAEDNSGDVVLRLYECSNSMTKCSLRCGRPVKKAYLTNMLEEAAEEVVIEDNSILLNFKGFEVVTLRLEF